MKVWRSAGIMETVFYLFSFDFIRSKYTKRTFSFALKKQWCCNLGTCCAASNILKTVLDTFFVPFLRRLMFFVVTTGSRYNFQKKATHIFWKFTRTDPSIKTQRRLGSCNVILYCFFRIKIKPRTGVFIKMHITTPPFGHPSNPDSNREGNNRPVFKNVILYCFLE